MFQKKYIEETEAPVEPVEEGEADEDVTETDRSSRRNRT